MKKSFILKFTAAVMVASVIFSACSGDDNGGAKSSTNMTSVVKVSSRGSVNPPKDVNGSQQRSAQAQQGGYYNFVADQTPPSANIISRAAFSTGGKWAYMEQTVSEGSVSITETVKYSGTYTGDIGENKNLILTVNSVADEQGLLVPVVKKQTFSFVVKETGEGVEFECVIPAVSYRTNVTDYSYSAFGLPEPQGENVFTEKELSSTSSFFIDETEIVINDVYSFITESTVIIDRTYNSVTGAAGVNAGLTAYYSFNKEKNELYFKLKDITFTQQDESILADMGVSLPDFVTVWSKNYYVDPSAVADETVVVIR